MALSEEEQRLLDEMERNLYDGDRLGASSASPAEERVPRQAPNYRAIVAGSLVALAGLAVLIGGVAIKMPLVGVTGFVVMFFGVLLALRPASAASSVSRSTSRVSGEPERGSSAAPTARSKSFAERLSERWEERQGPEH